ncbi:MAG: SIMPL domain-containing protein [Bacteriovoracaceae bacterium]|nr:SIMPL domain-containing protein [Bacteriovoracaceae bacterium]
MSKYLFFSFLLVLSQAYSHDKETLIPMISVQGTCIKQIVPDRGRVSLTVRELSKTPAEGQNRANEKYEKLRQDIKKLNLKDLELETSQFNVFERKEWEKDKMISKGFETSMGLTITTSEVDRLGEVLGLGSKYQVESQGGLESFVSSSRRQTEERNCLEVAMQDAKDKAKVMSETLKVKVGKPLLISENFGQSPMPQPRVMMMRKTMAQDSAEAQNVPQIEVGRQEIQRHIHVDFALE